MFIKRLEQVCTEDLYNKNQVRDIISKEFENFKDILDPLVKTASDALYDYFNAEYTYDTKNKRMDHVVAQSGFNVADIVLEVFTLVIEEQGNIKIQKLCGKLAPFFKFEDIWDGVRTAAEVIIVIGKVTTFYDIILAKYSASGSIEIAPKMKLEQDSLNKIAKFQYLPPITCKPMKLTNNRQSAYLTKNASVILGKNNHYDDPVSLDVLNYLNSIELSLDENILAIEEPLKFKKKAKNALTRQQRLDQTMRFHRASKEIYQEMLDKGNKFHLSWEYDCRGRGYSLGYHINIQSTEYKKALINFHEKEVIKLT